MAENLKDDYEAALSAVLNATKKASVGSSGTSTLQFAQAYQALKDAHRSR